jgi:O-antigen/teichoic acid export membrane protein
LERLVSKLIRNTLSNFGLNILTVILGFIALPVLIDALGDDGYGLLKLVGTVMGYFGILGAGVPAGTVKYVAEFEARDDQSGLFKVINTSFGFFLAVGVAAAGVIIVFASLGGLSFFEISQENLDTARNLLFIAAGFALVSWPATVLSNTLEGLQEHHTKNVIEAVTSVVRYGGSIAVALAGWGIVAVFLAQQASYIVRWVWLTIAVKRRLPDWNPNPFAFDTKTFKVIAAFSVWLLMTQVAVLLNYETDHLILGAFLSMATLTIYEIVTRPFAIIRRVSSLFNSAIMPAVSATDARKDDAGINLFAYTGGRYSNAFIAPVAVIGIFLCGPFIGLWVGEKYLEYAWIAQISCAFQLVWQSNSLMGRVFYGTGKVSRLAWLAILTALINAGLSIVLVQIWGVAGVVLATVFAGALAPALQYWWVFPELDIDRPRYFIHSVLLAQLPHLIIAAVLFLLLWEHFESIDTWWSLVGHLFAMLVPLMAISWFWSIEREHRTWVYERAREALTKFRGES